MDKATEMMFLQEILKRKDIIASRNKCRHLSTRNCRHNVGTKLWIVKRLKPGMKSKTNSSFRVAKHLRGIICKICGSTFRIV